MEVKGHQTSANDYLGDAAEYFVAYLLAQEGLEVYMAAKWGADLAVRDPKSKHWWRIEVKSTNTIKRKPYKKNKLSKKADVLARVKLSKNSVLEIELESLHDQDKVKWKPADGKISDFLVKLSPS